MAGLIETGYSTGDGWQYIVVPLKKHDMTELIKNVQAHPVKMEGADH